MGDTSRHKRGGVKFRETVEVVDHDMDVSHCSLDPSTQWFDANDTELGLGGSSNHSAVRRATGVNMKVMNSLEEEDSFASDDGDDDDLDLMVDATEFEDDWKDFSRRRPSQYIVPEVTIQSSSGERFNQSFSDSAYFSTYSNSSRRGRSLNRDTSESSDLTPESSENSEINKFDEESRGSQGRSSSENSPPRKERGSSHNRNYSPPPPSMVVNPDAKKRRRSRFLPALEYLDDTNHSFAWDDNDNKPTPENSDTSDGSVGLNFPSSRKKRDDTGMDFSEHSLNMEDLIAGMEDEKKEKEATKAKLKEWEAKQADDVSCSDDNSDSTFDAAEARERQIRASLFYAFFNALAAGFIGRQLGKLYKGGKRAVNRVAEKVTGEDNEGAADLAQEALDAATEETTDRAMMMMQMHAQNSSSSLIGGGAPVPVPGGGTELQFVNQMAVAGAQNVASAAGNTGASLSAAASAANSTLLGAVAGASGPAQIGMAVGIAAAAVACGGYIARSGAAEPTCGPGRDLVLGKLQLVFSGLTVDDLKEYQSDLEEIMKRTYNDMAGCDSIYGRYIEDAELSNFEDFVVDLDPTGIYSKTDWKAAVSCLGCPTDEPLFAHNPEDAWWIADEDLWDANNPIFAGSVQVNTELNTESNTTSNVTSNVTSDLTGNSTNNTTGLPDLLRRLQNKPMTQAQFFEVFCIRFTMAIDYWFTVVVNGGNPRDGSGYLTFDGSGVDNDEVEAAAKRNSVKLYQGLVLSPQNGETEDIFVPEADNVTLAPSSSPSGMPSSSPSGLPSLHPSSAPSSSPSVAPSLAPSSQPSEQPSYGYRFAAFTEIVPSTNAPSLSPTETPTAFVPRFTPLTILATDEPTPEPTRDPTMAPTPQPSPQPSPEPTRTPTEGPTEPPDRKSVV